MVDAAGDVSNTLGDIPNKAERIKGIIAAIAGQGKLGAVEIKDLASKMAKIAAFAPQFAGDAGKNIVALGAIGQEARQKGGAASAAEAATAVMSFGNTFSKGARLDQFKAHGVNVFENGKGGQKRDPLAIIKDAIEKTHGDGRALGDMFKDSNAQKAVRGFASTYTAAYDSTTGDTKTKEAAASQALTDEMQRLTDAQMGAGEIAESFAAAMKTSESQANAFNNQLQATTNQAQTALLPALEAMTPAILFAAQAASFFATGVAAFLKEHGLSPTEDPTKTYADNANALNAATAYEAKVNAGTNTEDDDAQAQLGLATLHKRKAKADIDLKESKDSQYSFFEKYANSPLGGTLDRNLVQAKKDSLKNAEGNTHNIEGIESKLERVMTRVFEKSTLKTHQVNAPKPGLTKPAAGTHPVEAKQ